LYAHQHQVLVQPGQAVSAGVQIGEMGGDPNDDDKIDGASTGTHLHFEVILPDDPKIDTVKTVLGYTVDPFVYLLNRYGPAPEYLAKVVEPKGVRVRIVPNDSKEARILYVLEKGETVKVVDVKGTDNGPWVKLWSLRDEWACAAYQGRKYLDLSPIPAVPLTPNPPVPDGTSPQIDPSTSTQDDLGGEKAARRNEVNRMIAFLQARLKELE
jgi:murein DD-endopeptidase MepM/ murein hydrolase activator NlpD